VKLTRFFFLFALGATALAAQQLDLHNAWMIQSSARVSADPATISQPGFATEGWYPATVPSTVFNALVENKIYPDPDYGMNLRQAAGVEYKIGANYSHEEIPRDSPYAVPWWFRTEFTLPPIFEGKTVWLDFHGINYRASIWLNGQQLASEEQAQGTFRRFEFDATKLAHAGGDNVLAVEVFAPRIHDLAITFVDWNPMPPDKDMGLWGAVSVRASGPVAIRMPFVATTLTQGGGARVRVTATLVNASDVAQRGTLRGSLGTRGFAIPVAVAAHASQTVERELTLAHPRLWWPHDLGQPNLYPLKLRFVVAGKVSDNYQHQVGLDQITSEKTAIGAEQFFINSRKLFVRGGGWTPDMLLRDGPARWALDFRYVRAMNLNTVRLEGKLPDDAFFDLADQQGVLVMAGWCCCDHWEEWGSWTGNEREVATASLRDQAERLRGHASLLVWLNGSDNPPPAPVEEAYLAVLREARWDKPILSSASGKPTKVTGASGVKMTGPYDYVPPDYWLEEPQLGGARGFNTETSPGAAIPEVESLRRFIPADHLWTASGPDDEFWNFHAGSGQFLNLHRYVAALSARYGAPASLEDYVRKSQASSYEGERAMFEAFGRQQGEATGVIQWMLDNGWPSLIWHLYDYYLRPGAGFYGVKQANQPLHIEYSPSDGAVSVVNHQLQSSSMVVAVAERYSLAGTLLDRHTEPVTVAAESSRVAMTLPAPDTDCFLRLTLRRAGAAIGVPNVYWLSAKLDVLDPKTANWYITPESSYADFSALSRLPPAPVKASVIYTRTQSERVARVRISNPTTHVAFMVRLQILAGANGDEVLPVWWSDNYMTLMPGETRTVTARIRLEDLGSAKPTLAVSGWNP